MFVDFEKGFDNVWRKASRFKLLYNNINGKIAKSSQELYIITNFSTFLTVEMVSDREKICQLSCSPFT